MNDCLVFVIIDPPARYQVKRVIWTSQGDETANIQ